MGITADTICRVVSQPLNIGVLATTLHRCECDHWEPHWRCELLTSAMVSYGFVEVRRAAGTECCIAEAHLRPLHDGDGVDEMVEIAGKPNETVEEAWRAIAGQIG